MLHVPSMEELGWRPLATAQRAEPNPSLETGTAARKADLFFASDNWFKAVAGRPLKNVAEDAKQGSRCAEEPASKPDRPLAAAGRTAQPRGDAKRCFVMTECRIRVRLTFDMRGGRQQAKLDVGRPFDGRVRRQACNSRRTSGWETATRSSVFAAPVGSRRPCSQSWSVRADTP